MNPGRFIAVLLGAGLLVGGWLTGRSSLVVSGIVVLLMYGAMQVYYGLGKRAFRRFVISDVDGFVKYWDGGIVWLQDTTTGVTYNHEYGAHRD